uniref:Tyrosine specific protein phosphatases domain-containing protein n=1 Tax=Mucochytrium quahogii TaxID=96639 RepID=A0A7S2RQI4_9STRA|mmetsp:Transcript_12350/g.20056  ORF Transcript_12350/g.20056 Transcript_12350/m.20056 type:complete len:277 (+) Transcript_12350:173-1003(+)|eukprot:CAMPEP_0203749860 /NCGR_PEP_ID=MMETSP0098-20131031/4251_1 /ASSEMBLY_ACC=CAM_ASM_000208 /TAXON_ID=96639 /ORGANISM=" , Strain NY0313808BC1" /LENGTH=276 /DNA_ID=CAMNT_0050638977 /DNA_START=175 /DNA_END=1005 /DNA_ORIENTATION=+
MDFALEDSLLDSPGVSFVLDQEWLRGKTGLDDVPNLRDVERAAPSSLKEGMLYRSSYMFSDQNVKSLGLRTVVDLRRVENRRCGIPNVQQVHVSLIDRATSVALFRSFPCLFKLKVVVTAPCRNLSEQVIPKLFESEESVASFYEVVLRNSVGPLRQVFEVLSKPSNYPCVVHCVAGKDRTGLVVALVLRLCDVPIPLVADDYSISETLLGRAIDENREDFDDILLHESSIRSPRESMVQVLTGIDRDFGSVWNFLEEHIGLDESQLKTIVSIMKK